jgi:prophage DNA circulation protein
MAWNDHLLPASFRGVAFHYDDTRRSGGRRLVEHEFPLRDDPYVEDLGRKKREHKITGYVIGDDYMSQRAALEVALDGAEAATLVHPYRGPLLVSIRSWTSQEVRDEGRMARFDIDCVESGSQPSPLAILATAQSSLSSGNDTTTQLQVSFLVNWLIGAGNTVAAAVQLLDDLSDALGMLLSWPDIDTSGIAPLIAGLSGDPTDVAGIASAVTGFFSGYASAVLAAQEPFDEALSSRGPLPVIDPSCGLAQMASWGGSEPPPPDAQSLANQEALIALVGGAAAVALSQIYASTAFHTQDDADTARDQLSTMIDGLATTSADSGDDDAFTSWQKLYQSSTDDLTNRAKQAPSTVTFTLGSALPALVLAQRLYRDPSRAGELVARNDAPHPLFVPPVVEALNS